MWNQSLHCIFCGLLSQLLQWLWVRVAPFLYAFVVTVALHVKICIAKYFTRSLLSFFHTSQFAQVKVCRPRSCAPGYYFNSRTCRCERRCGIIRHCPFNKKFNPSTCRCECRRFHCPFNKKFNPYTCRCECRRFRCPFNKKFNPKTCRCECRRFRCPFNKKFNPNTCRCECRRFRCPFNKKFNPKTCRCECRRFPCPFNKKFNFASCRCQCLHGKFCWSCMDRFNYTIATELNNCTVFQTLRILGWKYACVGLILSFTGKN